MTFLEILLAVAGFTVTAMVVAGMILLTPSGAEAVHADDAHRAGADPGSPAAADPEPAAAVAPGAR
jgi:K+ transporter